MPEPSTSTVFLVSGCSVMGSLCRSARCASIPRGPIRSIRRHENRKTETGQMMQRLIDPDQRPEPRMPRLVRHAEPRGAKSLGAVDRDVDEKIDDGDEPEPRRDHQD